MPVSEQIVNLENLAQGALLEQFQIEFQKVLFNIVDPNTDAQKPREITIKVKVVPSQSRDFALVSVSCVSKLAPAKPIATTLLIDGYGSVVSATEQCISPSLESHHHA